MVMYDGDMYDWDIMTKIHYDWSMLWLDILWLSYVWLSYDIYV